MPEHIKPLEPPDSHHLRAALGWLELGSAVEANQELEQIAPALRDHPDVLAVRYQVYSRTKQWDAAAEVAGRQIKRTPEDPAAWVGLAYATRRKSGGGIPQAREILTQAQSRFPDQSLIPYNLACYECQLGNLKQAWQWLATALAIGDIQQLKQMALADSDLQPLWEKIKGIRTSA